MGYITLFFFGLVATVANGYYRQERQSPFGFPNNGHFGGFNNRPGNNFGPGGFNQGNGFGPGGFGPGNNFGQGGGRPGNSFGQGGFGPGNNFGQGGGRPGNSFGQGGNMGWQNGNFGQGRRPPTISGGSRPGNNVSPGRFDGNAGDSSFFNGDNNDGDSSFFNGDDDGRGGRDGRDDSAFGVGNQPRPGAGIEAADPNVASQAVPPPGCTCSFTRQYDPVCGSNGISYNNEKLLECYINCGANIQLAYYGVCSARPTTSRTPSL